MFPPIAVPLRRQVRPRPERNNLCVSTSPPPGEPGQDTSSPELLFALFPPAVPAVDGDAHPPSRPRRRWRVPSVPVLSALIVGVLLSGVVVAVDHTNAEAVAGASPIVTATTAPNPTAIDLRWTNSAARATGGSRSGTTAAASTDSAQAAVTMRRSVAGPGVSRGRVGVAEGRSREVIRCA